jgi:16S rRNA (uracil1498-N3)-methyltransferase
MDPGRPGQTPPVDGPAVDASPADVLRAAEALVYLEDLDELVVDVDDAHHLVDVLRLSMGARVIAGDGAGSWRCCRVRDMSRAARGRQASVGLEPDGPIVSEPAPRAPVAIGFSVMKGERAEWTVQKLSELGVDTIVPLVSERTVVRLDEASARRRGERFRRIAREASAQSRRVRLPEVRDPVALADLMEEVPLFAESPAQVVFAEPGGGPLPRGTTMILTGPEGGWAPEEVASGWPRVDLGPQILRAETAAIVAGTILVALRSEIVRWGGAEIT